MGTAPCTEAWDPRSTRVVLRIEIRVIMIEATVVVVAASFMGAITVLAEVAAALLLMVHKSRKKTRTTGGCPQITLAMGLLLVVIDILPGLGAEEAMPKILTMDLVSRTVIPTIRIGERATRETRVGVGPDR